MKRQYILELVVLALLLCTACGKEQDSTTEYEIGINTEIESSTIPKEEDAITTELIEATTEITTEEINPREDILIAIDPGHQGPSVDMSAKEPNAPNSDVMKMKATSGTTGKYTGYAEYELNLEISLQLRDELKKLGYQVILTRENHETAISNSQRAIMANEADADVSIRIHANGSDDSNVNGALVLVGSAQNPYVGTLYEESYRLGETILDAYCESTGMKNLGIQTNDTMTGINWSTIPVVILEMGFMSNQKDDENMANATYQSSMVEGIVNGIEKYFYMDSPQEKVLKNTRIEGLQELLDTEVAVQTSHGDDVSVYVEDLESGASAEVNNQSLRAASLIKLYVAGCIYEEQVSSGNEQIQNVDPLVKKMLSVSDNDATNELVTRLGEGNAQVGMAKVNEFCQRHGLTDSSMGRLMLDFTSGKENYTSVKDSAAFLRSIYYGRLAGSEKMLSYLKEQERTGKIPAGIPAHIETANKTGELEHTENDVALIFSKGGVYVISVMTDNVSNTSDSREWIVNLSKEVYGKLQ